ncbi:MAG: flagellar export protein FliJ [Clostridium sp.]|nr:flagellar export protein FliJ [Clostridium sp.]
MTQGYKFKLQKLLDIREKEEEDKKIVFMEALQSKNKVESNLKNLEDNMKKYSQISNEMSTIDRKVQSQYLNLLNSTIDLTKKDLKKQERKVETKRKDLVEAQVNKKIVGILKDKDEARFIKEQSRIEQIQNDEFALYGYIRESGRR